MKKYIYSLVVLACGSVVYGTDDPTNPCPAELRVTDLENLSKAGAITNPKNPMESLTLKTVTLSKELQSVYNKKKTNADTEQHKLKVMLPKGWQVLSRGIVTEGRAKAERTLYIGGEGGEGKGQCEYKFADLFDKSTNREDSKFTLEIEKK